MWDELSVQPASPSRPRAATAPPSLLSPMSQILATNTGQQPQPALDLSAAAPAAPLPGPAVACGAALQRMCFPHHPPRHLRLNNGSFGASQVVRAIRAADFMQ